MALLLLLGAATATAGSWSERVAASGCSACRQLLTLALSAAGRDGRKHIMTALMAAPLQPLPLTCTCRACSVCGLCCFS